MTIFSGNSIQKVPLITFIFDALLFFMIEPLFIVLWLKNRTIESISQTMYTYDFKGYNMLITRVMSLVDYKKIKFSLDQ